MSDSSDDKDLQETKRLMVALLRRPPKPHEEMKIGKSSGKKKASPKKRKNKDVAACGPRAAA
jgi:hypothetical protein